MKAAGRWRAGVSAVVMSAMLMMGAAAQVWAEQPQPQADSTAQTGSNTAPGDANGGAGGADSGTGGSDNGSGGSSANAAGMPYVTAYTVTDGYGNERQRIEPNEKCRIVLAVVDPRFSTPDELKLPDGRALVPNIKVVSTSTFSSPSLGDISTTTLTPESVVSGVGLKYAIILNDTSFLGGTSNELVVDVSYNDGTRSLATLRQNISQCGVASKEAGGKPSSLIIKAAGYGTGDVTAGETFTLSTTIFAAGNQGGAENVSVSLALPEEITVVSGSSYQFIGDMKPNSTQEVRFQLSAGAVAKAGSYNISIEVAGNAAADGAALSAKMPMTVPVIQPDRFEISNVEMPDNMMMGEEAYASVALVNKGKGSVYNVEAKLEGEGFTVDEGASKFVGNIASGTQSTQDFSIQPTQAGTINLKLVVSYEDEKASVKTVTREFTITVDEAMMGSGSEMGMGFPDGEMPSQPAPGIPVWGWLLMVLLLAGIGVTVLIIVKKKRANKRAAYLMEDDDEDL